MGKNSKIIFQEPHSRMPILFIFLVGVVLASCTSSESLPEPEIVEIYTCEDNCAGEKSSYLTKIYDGVTDEKRCTELKGTIISVSDEKYCTVQDQQ